MGRVVLEQDLKREYQKFLQEPNRNRPDRDGRPGRDAQARLTASDVAGRVIDAKWRGSRRGARHVINEEPRG